MAEREIDPLMWRMAARYMGIDAEAADRALAKAEAEHAQCTGIAARWCPIHGDCTDRGAYERGHCDDPRCPLHGNDSLHADFAGTREGPTALD